MNKLRAVLVDIVGALTHIEMMGKTREECNKEVKRLESRIQRELTLVRDRYAASNLITAMLCEVNGNKMCLAYEYKGKLYSTAKNVPGMRNTDPLHNMGLPMLVWDSMPKHTVWIGTGTVYESEVKV